MDGFGVSAASVTEFRLSFAYPVEIALERDMACAELGKDTGVLAGKFIH